MATFCNVPRYKGCFWGGLNGGLKLREYKKFFKIKFLNRNLVRSRRLELPRVLPHSDLNAARLPIPPRPHILARGAMYQRQAIL